MSGFPTRTGRGGYGPNPINARPVRDPRKELDGETQGRLMFWQLGAAGLMLPQAWFLCHLNGSTVVCDAHSEAFQPSGGAAPTLTHPSALIYEFAYAATYPDEQGVAVPLVLRGCCPSIQDEGVYGATHWIHTDGHSGGFRVLDLATSGIEPAKIFVPIW